MKDGAHALGFGFSREWPLRWSFVPGILLGTHVGPIPADGVWREQSRAKGGAEL